MLVMIPLNSSIVRKGMLHLFGVWHFAPCSGDAIALMPMNILLEVHHFGFFPVVKSKSIKLDFSRTCGQNGDIVGGGQNFVLCKMVLG